METMGPEVSQKIRSAIKAKLIELAAYVDDELPDYIMVMVANKKSRGHMSEDLSLFLGNNTENFTKWLHSVLDRLQLVTSESKESEAKAKEAVATGEPAGVSSSKVESVAKEEDKAPAGPAPLESELKVSDSEDLDNQEDFLAIKAELDADDIEALKDDDEIAEPQEPAQAAVVAPSVKQQNVVAPLQHVSKVETVMSESVASRRLINLRQESLPQPNLKRAFPAPVVQPIAPKRRAPSSEVGAVVHRPVFGGEEDEDNDNNVHISRTGLASVIRVSQRKFSVPKERQANKKLILKAMNDAHKSVKATVASTTLIDPYEPSPIRALFTKKYKCKVPPAPVVSQPQHSQIPPAKYIEEVSDELMDLEVSIPTECSPTEVEEEMDDLPSKMHPVLHFQKRKYVLVDIEDQSMPESVATKPHIFNYDEEARCRVLRERKSSSEDERSSSPKFVVTLDGINSADFLGISKKPLLKGARSNVSSTSMDSLAFADSDGETGSDITSSPVAQNRTSGSGGKDSSSERCKYWPACKLRDGCPYRHPSSQCKTFPNCKYGDKCLYIHPNCKFDATCTKNNCPYTHASKRGLTAAQPVRQPRVAAPRTIRCKYFPTCTNMNCAYNHPKPCWYGLSCTQSDCTFSHPALPPRNKMKWKSTAQSPIGSSTSTSVA